MCCCWVRERGELRAREVVAVHGDEGGDGVGGGAAFEAGAAGGEDGVLGGVALVQVVDDEGSEGRFAGAGHAADGDEEAAGGGEVRVEVLKWFVRGATCGLGWMMWFWEMLRGVLELGYNACASKLGVCKIDNRVSHLPHALSVNRFTCSSILRFDVRYSFCSLIVRTTGQSQNPKGLRTDSNPF